MESTITSILSQDLVQALVHTLLHSLWQAPLIALIMYVMLRRLHQSASHKRHNIALASIILLCACSLFTLMYYIIDASAMVTIGSSSSTNISTTTTGLGYITNQGLEASSSASVDLMGWISTHQYRIAISWIVGVVLFSSRILLGGWHMRYIRESVSYDLDRSISDSLQRMSRHLGLDKVVKIGVSTLVKTPMMMGHLKPIIILPLAAINQLSSEEVESIIAHELGHIMRNDFVKNIFILLMESLYFFNPAIWWMCGIIRSERESASDDIALRLGVDPYRYVKTLVRLEELQQPAQSGLALHINGTSNSLLNRVKRILQQPIHQSFVWERGAAMLLLMITLVTVTTASHSIKSQIWSTSPLSHRQIEPIETNPPAVKLSLAPVALYMSDNRQKEPSESLAKADTIPDRDQHNSRQELKKVKRKMERASRSWEKNLRSLKYKIRGRDDLDNLSEEEKEEVMEEIEDAMYDLHEEMESIDMEDIHEELNEAMRVLHEETANIHIDINEDLVDIHENMSELSHELAEGMAEFGIDLGTEMAELGVALGREMADIFDDLDLDDHGDRLYWQNDREDRRHRRNNSYRRSHDAAKRVLAEQMNSDNLWQGEQNTLSITNSELIINGKRQSTSQHSKYLEMLAGYIPEIKDENVNISLTVKGTSLEDAKSVSFSISIDE